MLSCKDASRLISQSLDRRLTWSERMTLRAHLLICDVCKRFSNQLGLMRIAVKRMAHQIERDEQIRLSEEAKLRITKVIETNRG